MRPVRVLGHPVHPITVHLPVGLLATTTLLHALELGGVPSGDAARWTLGLGLATGVLAASAGVVDLLAAPEDAAVERRIVAHVSAMSLALTCYGGAFVLDGLPALGLVALGLVLLLGGGWAGGELVYGHGVGVRRATGDATCDSTDSPRPAERS